LTGSQPLRGANTPRGSNALRVLIVDDEEDIRDLLSTYLGKQGIEVFEAGSEAELRAIMISDAPDVVLLDVNLGTEDGFAIARRLRADWSGGLLMVTGRGDTVDRVVGLEIGADDYVTKPFDLRELLARVRSVGRRAVVQLEPTTVVTHSPNSLRFHGFTLDVERRKLTDADDNEIPLTTGEFALLVALVEKAGTLLSRDALLRRTHHRDAGPFDRTVDVQIGRLRKKLGDDGKEPHIIKSVRGAGYVLVDA
jgi:two-component system, OmpR family, response regulator